MSEREGWTFGNFVTRGVSLPPIHIDCSNWVDTSDGTWTFGNFETRRRVLPPIHVDCSGWGREPTPATHLELVVSFAAGVGPDRLTDLTVGVVEGILSLAPPALGLAYDRAEPTAGGDVRVLLRTGRPATTAEVAELNRLLRLELDKPPAERRPELRDVGELEVTVAA